MPDAAKIAGAFLTDSPHEVDLPGAGDVRLLIGARDREHDRETTAVVRYSRSFEALAFALHLHVCSFREHRIEMARDHHRGSVARTRPLADHVAFRIDANVLKAD
jgi:hypothetical protein